MGTTFKGKYGRSWGRCGRGNAGSGKDVAVEKEFTLVNPVTTEAQGFAYRTRMKFAADVAITLPVLGITVLVPLSKATGTVWFERFKGYDDFIPDAVTRSGYPDRSLRFPWGGSKGRMLSKIGCGFSSKEIDFLKKVIIFPIAGDAEGFSHSRGMLVAAYMAILLWVIFVLPTAPRFETIPTVRKLGVGLYVSFAPDTGTRPRDRQVIVKFTAGGFGLGNFQNNLAHPGNPVDFFTNILVKLYFLTLAGYQQAHFQVVLLGELVKIHRGQDGLLFVQVTLRVEVFVVADLNRIQGFEPLLLCLYPLFPTDHKDIHVRVNEEFLNPGINLEIGADNHQTLVSVLDDLAEFSGNTLGVKKLDHKAKDTSKAG